MSPGKNSSSVTEGLDTGGFLLTSVPGLPGITGKTIHAEACTLGFQFIQQVTVTCSGGIHLYTRVQSQGKKTNSCPIRQEAKHQRSSWYEHLLVFGFLMAFLGSPQLPYVLPGGVPSSLGESPTSP